MQRGIERTRFHFERILGGALDVPGDGVAVRRAANERSKDQEVKRALQKLHVGGGVPLHGVVSLLDV
jgi:hypothetical protein